MSDRGGLPKGGLLSAMQMRECTYLPLKWLKGVTCIFRTAPTSCQTTWTLFHARIRNFVRETFVSALVPVLSPMRARGKKS